MARRELDIRLSATGRKALIALQRHFDCRPGEVLCHVVAMGVRPQEGSFGRDDAVSRMRATVDDRMATDFAAVAADCGVSVERYVEALLVAAESRLFPVKARVEKAAAAVPSCACKMTPKTA